MGTSVPLVHVRTTTRLADTAPAQVGRCRATFYSPEHVQAGHIVATGRDGEKRTCSLLTLSVAALDSETLGAASSDSIANLLAHVKKLAKQKPGNSFVLRSGERVLDLSAPGATQPTSSDLLPIGH